MPHDRRESACRQRAVYGSSCTVDIIRGRVQVAKASWCSAANLRRVRTASMLQVARRARQVDLTESDVGHRPARARQWDEIGSRSPARASTGMFQIARPDQSGSCVPVPRGRSSRRGRGGCCANDHPVGVAELKVANSAERTIVDDGASPHRGCAAARRSSALRPQARLVVVDDAPASR